MDLEKAKSELSRIADAVDERSCKVLADCITRLCLAGDVSAPVVLNQEEELQRRMVQRVGVKIIKEFVLANLDCEQISELAATYLIQKTRLTRLREGADIQSDNKGKKIEGQKWELAEQRKRIKAMPAKERRMQAQRGGIAKNAKHADAKKFVLEEWSKHQAAYKGNKSAFSRDYAARVRREFTDRFGVAIHISEKQIREVWLSNTPAAGKQAG